MKGEIIVLMQYLDDNQFKQHDKFSLYNRDKVTQLNVVAVVMGFNNKSDYSRDIPKFPGQDP